MGEIKSMSTIQDESSFKNVEKVQIIITTITEAVLHVTEGKKFITLLAAFKHLIIYLSYCVVSGQ